MLPAAQGQPVVLSDTWLGFIARHATQRLHVPRRQGSCRAVTSSTWRLGSKGHTSWQCPRPCPATSPHARRPQGASAVFGTRPVILIRSQHSLVAVRYFPEQLPQGHNLGSINMLGMDMASLSGCGSQGCLALWLVAALLAAAGPLTVHARRCGPAPSLRALCMQAMERTHTGSARNCVPRLCRAMNAEGQLHAGHGWHCQARSVPRTLARSYESGPAL